MDHTKSKARHPQTSGMCERFHEICKDEFYSIAFRKMISLTVEELQQDLDAWLELQHPAPRFLLVCFQFNVNTSHR